ncbi:16S rRNA processing protein RimM [Galdieria sulphuraria]|uniref:16S rRNA processing protein RimM n=1 Tax=Galdieria sulphuraria TaxID=130081 RepID=M2WA34_GALSU|nr:16S rRNA processing protein RimM [Galdieria sulphuraria]EME32761.1 16S rRNA processing protein RimM [Galdieria sulphuraria]|eukprot:XP_005709281.1 16S rRNA processing protein RimM [Galdieria sulphuraria]
MYVTFLWFTINIKTCRKNSLLYFPFQQRATQCWRCQTQPDSTNSSWRELYSPESFGFSQIGIVKGPHGIQGELKIVATCDFSHLRLLKKGTRYLLLPNRKYPRPVILSNGRKASQQNTFIIRLKHITSREQAQQLKQAQLFVRSGEGIKLKNEEEYLARSLLDSEALDIHSQRPLGKVVNVYTREEILSLTKPGSQDILVSWFHTTSILSIL